MTGIYKNEVEEQCQRWVKSPALMRLILNMTHRKRMPKVVAERLNTSQGLSNKLSPLHQSRIESSMYNQSQAKWSTVSMHNCVYIHSSMCRFEAPQQLRNYVNVPCRLSEYHSRLRGVLRLFSEWKLVVPLLPGLCHVTGTCSVAPAPSERPITLLAQARWQETSAKSHQVARLKAQWYI